MRLLIPPGVFTPRSDTWMLAGALRDLARPGTQALDLCTGSGALAIAAAQAGADATAVDVSRRSVLVVRLNAVLNGVGRRVRAVRGDLFAAVEGSSFDLIVSNPPYVPAEDERLPVRGPSRAWDAGLDGRVLIDRICEDAPARLRRGGTLLMVHSSLCGTEQTLTRLSDAGLDAEVAESRRGPLGPLMLARVHDLERRGLLSPGEREEEVVVIRARAGAS